MGVGNPLLRLSRNVRAFKIPTMSSRSFLYTGYRDSPLSRIRLKIAPSSSVREIARTCNAQGVKSYLTVNTIIYDQDLTLMRTIIDAAKAAKVDYFIRTMPHGYDTVLDNEASALSAGQRQLLTIARVFLCDPPILILDEATSSVDMRTETEIGKVMNQLMKGRTSFIIAHRLSTIRDADTILFMDHGNIIEQGSHEELLKKNGAYAALYYSQFE